MVNVLPPISPHTHMIYLMESSRLSSKTNAFLRRIVEAFLKPFVCSTVQRSIAHRDLKAANLMMDVNGNIKISDLGAAVVRFGASALPESQCGPYSSKAYEQSINKTMAGELWSTFYFLPICRSRSLLQYVTPTCGLQV